MLLSAFQHTGDRIWLERAIAFANFAVSQCQTMQSELFLKPDDPRGLVNGIGGLVFLLACLRHVLHGGNRIKLKLPFLWW